MNRQYKFRGKHNLSGEWVYGNLVEGVFKDTMIQSKDESGFLSTVVVDKETVGQFIGLKDSKGIDIYEGQIINDRVQDCVVEWDTREAKFNLSIIYNDEAFDIRQTHKPMPLDAMGITIIGDLCDKV